MQLDIRRRPLDRIRDELVPAVMVLRDLVERDFFSKMKGWFPCIRPRGYDVVGLFAAAVLFFLGTRAQGLRPFLEGLGVLEKRRIGAVVGLRTLPTAASLSRALTRFKHDEVRGCVQQMLASTVEKEMLTNPVVQHHDGWGQPWHVLDIDPTITGIRRRELPEGDDLPRGVRRARGEAGYVGRKRGEARIRVVPVMHDGAGLWLAMLLVPTEGSITPFCRELARNSMAVLRERGVDENRVVIRGDGEFGSVGAMRAIVDSGAAVLVRLTRYQLLDRESVAFHLQKVEWNEIRRGESGITREAAELGTFTLTSSVEDTKDEPVTVTVRVVVTRFERSSPAEHGVKRDGHQLELFATTLPSEAWPAADVAELYRGRSSLENRFAQEDREFDLERTFSHHPPGQEWMSGVGLFLWNYAVVRGWHLAPPPPRPPPLTRRSPTSKPAEDSIDAALSTTGSPTSQPSEPPHQPTDTPESIVTESNFDHLSEPVDEPSAMEAEKHARARLADVVERAFANVGWQGWSFVGGDVRCPNGQKLIPFAVGALTKGSGNRISLRTEPYACTGCPVRATCFHGKGPYKLISKSIDPDDTATALAALRKLREKAATRPPAPRENRKFTPSSAQSMDCPTPFFTPPLVKGIPAFHFEPPRFLPAAARRRAAAHYRAFEIRILLGKRRPTKPHEDHPSTTTSMAGRAHRRLPKHRRSSFDKGPEQTRIEINQAQISH